MEKKSNPRILAIDPGSKHLGYAHMVGEHITMSGTLDLWGNAPRTRYTLYYWTNLQLDGIQHDSGIMLTPEYVILELYFPQRQRGATIIPELRGIIKLSCDQHRIEVVEVAPGTVKKFVTGHGRSSKEEVRKVINTRYGLGIKSTDQSDSIACGLAGLDKIRKMEDIDNVEA